MTMIHDKSLPKPTILIVDDEAGPRDALKVILRPFFHIHSADTAKAALTILNEEQIDLMTLDQRLPDRQGIDLLQDIKLKHPGVEVIIITGYGSLKSAMEGIGHGAAGYLLKPFNVTDLIALTNQTLEKKKRLEFLRHTLHASQALWETGDDSVQAWNRLRSEYEGLTDKPASTETALPQDEGDVLPLLSDILEAHDKQLLNHSTRVSHYATLMANRLNLSMTDQKLLAMGAFLHDIGHVGLPTGRVSDHPHIAPQEASLDRTHPERGAQIIRSLSLPSEVGQIALHHHERWDGQGYPYSLGGEEIPLFARVVSIAQAFDHLTALTPGRLPLSVEAATNQISLQSGTHFDPTLLALFVAQIKDSSTPFTPFSAMGAAA